MKAEFSRAESGFQIGDEFGAEQTAEHLDRKEKLPAARNPVALVGRDPAARNDAVEMRMMMKVLSPGMQHRQKAYPGAEVLGVGGDLQQGFGCRTEENAINHPLVPQRQRRDQLGHGEDHMEVLDRQQLRSTLFKPSRSGLSMTLRAMAIAARAISNFAVAAPISLLNVTTEGRCAADRNRPQRLLLFMRERVSKRRQVSRAVEAENVAQLQRRRFH